MKHCSVCGKDLPPNVPRVLLEVRHVPKVWSWKFWVRLYPIVGDVNMEIFCSDEHLADYLQHWSQKMLPAK